MKRPYPTMPEQWVQNYIASIGDEIVIVSDPAGQTPRSNPRRVESLTAEEKDFALAELPKPSYIPVDLDGTASGDPGAVEQARLHALKNQGMHDLFEAQKNYQNQLRSWVSNEDQRAAAGMPAWPKPEAPNPADFAYDTR